MKVSNLQSQHFYCLENAVCIHHLKVKVAITLSRIDPDYVSPPTWLSQACLFPIQLIVTATLALNIRTIASIYHDVERL